MVDSLSSYINQYHNSLITYTTNNHYLHNNHAISPSQCPIKATTSPGTS